MARSPSPAAPRWSWPAAGAGWQTPEAQKVLSGGSSLDALEAYVLAGNINPQPRSGKQELLENVVNRYV